MTTPQPLPPAPLSPAPNLVLNEDILLMLLSCIRSKKTLYALMQTCRQLYAAGMPWYLRLRHQLTPNNLRAFYAFLLEDARPRFAALRDLDFIGGSTRGEKKIIADIIRRAANLKALRIDMTLLLSRDKICTSVTSLRKLEQLHVDNMFQLETENVLSSLRGPLRRIHVQDFKHARRSMITFSEFEPTLERIVCSGGMRYSRFSPKRPCTFPNVVSFRETMAGPAMSILTSFPNLKILALKNQRDPFNHISNTEDDVLGFHRRTAQREANLAFIERSGCWDSLVYLDIDAVCLYTLAPQCRVTYLAIKKLSVFGERDLLWFHESMTAMRPTYLRIHTVVGESPRFAEVLTSGTEDVRKLWMNLVITSKLPPELKEEIHDLDDLDDLDYIQSQINEYYEDGLVDLFNELPPGLRVLECRISTAWSKGERRGKSGGITPLHHPATNFLRKLDVKFFIQRAAMVAPELLAVRMEIGSGKTSVAASTSYWVDRTEVVEGIEIQSIEETSAEEYRNVSFIERDVVAFLKENHYGHL